MPSLIKSIINENVLGKTVFIRADLNIPISQVRLNIDQLIKCNDEHPGRQFHIDFVDDMLNIIKNV